LRIEVEDFRIEQLEATCGCVLWRAAPDERRRADWLGEDG